jgi:hypothetical protein
MNAGESAPRLVDPSPQVKARLAGVLYLINIVTSLIAFSGKGSRTLIATSGISATASYVAVTILLYYLFKPVHARLSFLAALSSLAGCAAGVLGPFHVIPFHVHPLVFFGLYCLFIAVLIFKSTFLPRILGGFMAIAGLGWLTFLSRPLAASLSPYHYVAGGIGEGLLTLRLLVMGVDAARWNEQAGASTVARSPAVD